MRRTACPVLPRWAAGRPVSTRQIGCWPADDRKPGDAWTGEPRGRSRGAAQVCLPIDEISSCALNCGHKNVVLKNTTRLALPCRWNVDTFSCRQNPKQPASPIQTGLRRLRDCRLDL